MTLNSIRSRNSITSFEFRKTPPPGPDYGVQICHSGSGHYTIVRIFVPYTLQLLSFVSFYLLLFLISFFFFIASPSLHAPAITTMAPNNTQLALNQGRARMLPIFSKPNRWQVSKNLQKKEVGFLLHLHLTLLLWMRASLESYETVVDA